MPDRVFSIEEILAILADHPPRLTALTANLTSAQLRTAPAADEWSANAVLAHMRSCCDVWGGCIATFLTQDKPTIRAVNPRTWIRRTNYLELDFQPSLQAFITQRTDLLALLKSLPPESWSRSATMTGAGRPFEHTVHSYAERLARHERPHVRQIEDIINTLHR